MAAGPFRYPFDIQTTLEPLRHELGHSFDQVVAAMADRDRALEDYVDRVIYDRVNSRVTFGGGETIQLGAWTDWAATMGADTTAPTLGAGSTTFARYARNGRTVTGDFIYYFGGAGLNAGAGSYRFNLPFPPVWNVDHRVIGNGYLFDSSASDLKTFQLVVPAGSTTWAYGIVHSGGGPVNFVGSATYPWATGDRLLANFAFESVT